MVGLLRGEGGGVDDAAGRGGDDIGGGEDGGVPVMVGGEVGWLGGVMGLDDEGVQGGKGVGGNGDGEGEEKEKGGRGPAQ